MLELAGPVDRGRGLVREHAQRLQPFAGGQQPVGRLVHPDVAGQALVAIAERDEQPVVVPGPPAAAVQLRAVHDAAGLRQTPLCVIRGEEEAALDLEGGVEERAQEIHRELLVQDCVPDRQAGRRVRAQQPGFVVEQLYGDPLEAERRRDAVRDLLQDLVRTGAAHEL